MFVFVVCGHVAKFEVIAKTCTQHVKIRFNKHRCNLQEAKYGSHLVINFYNSIEQAYNINITKQKTTKQSSLTPIVKSDSNLQIFSSTK